MPCRTTRARGASSGSGGSTGASRRPPPPNPPKPHRTELAPGTSSSRTAIDPKTQVAVARQGRSVGAKRCRLSRRVTQRPKSRPSTWKRSILTRETRPSGRTCNVRRTSPSASLAPGHWPSSSTVRSRARAESSSIPRTSSRPRAVCACAAAVMRRSASVMRIGVWRCAKWPLPFPSAGFFRRPGARDSSRAHGRWRQTVLDVRTSGRHLARATYHSRAFSTVRLRRSEPHAMRPVPRRGLPRAVARRM